MFCPNCGKEIDDDVVFCPNCGYSMKGNAQQNKLRSNVQQSTSQGDPRSSAMNGTNNTSPNTPSYENEFIDIDERKEYNKKEHEKKS